MKNSKPLSSLKFKSWSYYVLFALSILLLLQFFQMILIEPFYKKTLENDIRNLNHQIASIYFDSEEQNDVSSQLYSLTVEKNACMLIYDRESGATIGYDALGENGCAIYRESIVNTHFIEELDESEEGKFIEQGKLIDLSNVDIIVYGEEYQRNNGTYYILSNLTVQPINLITKTLQNQFVIISLMMLLLSLFISLLFSSIISRPIEQITSEAKKLTYGDYNLKFENYDINEVDELAQTIELASNEIEKVDDLRKELMSNVSHDIKTPLTMIKAYAEMIKDISGENREKRNEHLDIIINETDLLTKLVNDMLDLSKLQAGAVSVSMEPFDLSGEIIETVNKFQTVADKQSVKIVLECEPELIAIGDQRRISEVLYNFISNALKHYGDDNTIIVKAYLADSEKVMVEVIDHGTGISEEALPYIWDRYFKIDKQYSRSHTGTGLGLAINKAILEAHKSQYGVESKLGEGSRFYFSLTAYEVK